MTNEAKIKALGQLALDGIAEVDRVTAAFPGVAIPESYTVTFDLEGRTWRLSIASGAGEND